MMFKCVKCVVILFLFCGSAIADTQFNSTWMWSNINNEDGLSNSAVTSIYMDYRQQIWFGTWDGLNLYDGVDIKVFKPDIFRDGTISNNIIRDFIEDKFHNLWVMTDNGINKLNEDQLKFKSYLYDIADLPVKEHNVKSCLLGDSLLICVLYGYGTVYYDAKTDQFKKIDLPDISEEDEKGIIGLYGQANGRLFLLTEKGEVYAYQLGKTFEKLYKVDYAPSGTELLLDNHWFLEVNSSLYIAVAVKGGGVILKDIINLEYNSLPVELEKYTVTTINSSDNDDFLWVGTDNGSIFRVKINRTNCNIVAMSHYFTHLTRNQLKIWTIQQTSDDLLWVGTDGGGVYSYMTKGKPFYNIKKGDNRQKSISHNIVRAIVKDRNGDLWIGTRGDGLNMISHKGGKTSYYNVDNGLSNNAVISLGIDKSENLWIGVDGEGIDMLEKSTGKILHFPKDFANDVDLDFGAVYSICVDVYGVVWLGTSGYGLLSLDITQSNGQYYLNDYKHYTYSNDCQGLKSNIVYAIVEECPNVLWIGTRRGGLHRLNSLNGTFEVFGVDNERENSLSNDDILSLTISNDNKLWIGTSGGLNLMNLSYRPYQFDHYTEYDGLPNNTIHGILQDIDNNIWLSTNRGLSKYIVSKNEFVNFNKSDGLQNNEYTDGAVFNDTINGLLYFGGIEGIDWFNPSHIKHVNHFPPIVINEFKLYNTLVLPCDTSILLTKSINNTDKIVLKHDQNFFSFSFSTLNYYNAEKCEFAYMLEGFDKDWNYIKTQRTANFTNVPHGIYQFKVKATNEDGIFGEQIKTLTVVVKPPIWNTIYAYVLYFILLCLMLLFFFYFANRRMKRKKELEIEKIHRQKKDEINQYKLQFFTNIAHEFRTPLTLIMAPAVTLMKDLKEDKKLNTYAKAIYQNADRLQRLIKELIEFRKVETGNMKLEIRQQELVEYIGELVKAFDFFARQSGVELSFTHLALEIYAWIDIRKMEKILLNLISNAIKYTPRNGAVDVRVEKIDDKIHLLVKDTGIGIPEDMREKIFDRFFHDEASMPRRNKAQEGTGVGLSLTKSLVELHKGTITVSGSSGKGSCFEVIIPVGKSVYEDSIVEDEYLFKTDDVARKVFDEVRADKVESKDLVEEQNEEEIEESGDLDTVLIVDDNDDVCDLLNSLLVNEYNIIETNNGQEALDVIKSRKVDVVVSDVMMPVMNGLELCATIKNDINMSHIPIILLTAKGELEQRIEGLEAGADSYIPKPFHPDHLMVRIKKLLELKERFRNAYKEYDDKSQNELFKGLSPKDQKLLSELNKYIEDQLEDSLLNADHLSKFMAMSKTQLYRKIKILTGYTPHGLIKYVRLKKAAELLETGEFTVSEVFYETGFNNRTYFYRSFKQAFGVTPGEYAKKS